MAGLCDPSAPAARWKRHIVRQLRQRDRTQKALFLELVPAYTHLLEKAELLAKFSEKLQPQPNDVTPSTQQGSWEVGGEEKSSSDSDQVSSLATLRVKWQEEEEGVRLVCGEMAYQVVQKSAALGTMQSELEERQGRANQARVSQELKKAAKRTVSISKSPDTLGDGIREETESQAAEPESLERETCEKWKRPFRSASATSLTLFRCVDVVKGLLDFKKRRGHSVGGAPEQLYQSIPVCVAARLPTQAQDVLDAHLSEINAVQFGPSSSLLATGGDDRRIHLWNVVGGRLEANQTLEGAGGSITSVDFDPSGSQVLAATYNQAAQLWKVGVAQSKETLSGHKDKVTAARFKLTKHQAVTGSRDRTVKEWDLGRAYCSRTINVISYCNDVVCGDHIIISGHNDQKIRFWDSRLPSCTQVIPVQGRVTSLSLSRDQMHLLSCSRDDTLKVIDLRVSNIRQVFRADGFKCGSDWTKAVFSPDGSYALAGSGDGALYIWNADTGKLESSLRGPHCAAVNAVAWCSSGSHVVSVDQARKMVLWH
ncbi:protein Atg16l2 isoform X3 [Perognathus longimembris pacificus]|uniref:protein Atg16l2 isoform X3 n=1 Tax=Perognathus longimembris pacificus TaxID=214514 RepID=UPI0020185337|nr:protein Atg16l2 isoform X3 [Perognathus longimembris pacificus]